MDTHIWVRWILNNNPLPPSILDIIETSDAVAVSAISIWEVVLLEKRKRIELPCTIEEWISEALAGSDVESLPITTEIAYLASMLPEHHKDPADRLIIATSVLGNFQLISLDTLFPLYLELKDNLIA
ncbi:type II toxin-antitoxin system VapC family toxin [Methylicorpusculum sp.]|uniref:type II toxin-antitoxin system VapC family toxin n=1 Tax=Methylicorpusculum sp. TaxID=2713644 RepID=UPI00273063B6|nr:type II toxin-antitoxin system VapC family toxin [Methylicorpusculum sp.]MDP2180569.1 type II toxin-antitoxin system VapC family toxin [Methylicorpusculum sp.]MDP3527729.1 type II toxin-antitoxin system VapC family toxin [Methylicorpusculum sp.]